MHYELCPTLANFDKNKHAKIYPSQIMKFISIRFISNSVYNIFVVCFVTKT